MWFYLFEFAVSDVHTLCITQTNISDDIEEARQQYVQRAHTAILRQINLCFGDRVLCESRYLRGYERSECHERVSTMVRYWAMSQALIRPVPEMPYDGLTFYMMEEKVRLIERTIECLRSLYTADAIVVNHSPRSDLLEELEVIRKSCRGLSLVDYLQDPKP